jgi:hypothetical protein
MIDAVAMRKLVLTTAILLLSVAAFFWLSGSVVVIDETRGVQTAVITNSGGSEQELHRLWSGFFYAIPRMEGTIEVPLHRWHTETMGLRNRPHPCEIEDRWENALRKAA